MAWRRLVPVVLALGVVISLSGCGQIFGRTAKSRIPEDVRLIRVHIHPARNFPDQYSSINNPKIIAHIVKAFNRLPLKSNRTTGCAADYGQYANLTFVLAGGRTIQVHDWLACHTLSISTSSQKLFGKGEFFTLVERVLPSPSSKASRG